MINKDFIYLDNGATSYPKPDAVYRFMDSFYRTEEATMPDRIVDETRQLLTKLFNGGDDHKRLVFGYNATDLLNIVINGLVEQGAHVVSTMLEHNSVLRPLRRHQSEGTIELSLLPFDGAGYVNPADIMAAIRPETKFVVVTHCSNVLGTRQPLAEIGKICRSKGVIFVVDGSQGAGSVDFDMRACGVDVYCFTGHKSLMGPNGIGGAYIGEGVEIKQTRVGGGVISSESVPHPAVYPYRLECGTKNVLGIAGLYAGVKWITEQGIAILHDREMRLWQILVNEMRCIHGVELYCADSAENHNPSLSFNISGISSELVGNILLSEYNIKVRTGLQCAPLLHERIGTAGHGTVRVGIGAFNTERDIAKIVLAIREIAAKRSM